MNATSQRMWIWFLAGAMLLSGFEARAVETKVIVRAKGKDAKFIGSSLGGAYVIIRNTTTGAILAEGKTEGTTGNTGLIMNAGSDRYKRITDDETARFLAIIDIDEPKFVRIEVVAPLNYKNARLQATTELWLIPGKHLVGDGIVIEIPGFIVDVLSPGTHQYIPLSSLEKGGLPLQANIVMMCGCLIDKGGLWNSDEMEVRAIVKKDGQLFKNVLMKLSSPNRFDGQIPVAEKGNFEVVVYAYHEKSGNTGVGKVNFVIH